MSSIEMKDMVKIIDLYFSEGSRLVQHHIRGYEDFVEKVIFKKLNENENFINLSNKDDKSIKDKFVFKNIEISEPTYPFNPKALITPTDARHKSMTYSSLIYADVEQIRIIEDLDTKEQEIVSIGSEKRVPIARIPTMVKSRYCVTSSQRAQETQRECLYDKGGYYIVNGSEKVLISQEATVANKIRVIKKKEQNSVILKADIKSVSLIKSNMVQMFSVKMKKNGLLMLTASHFKDEVHAFVLLKALGLETDEQIANYITYDTNDYEMINLLQLSFETCVAKMKKDTTTKIFTKKEATDELVEYMKRSFHGIDDEKTVKYKRMYMKHFTENELLPHLGKDVTKKAYFICFMINRLLSISLGRANVDDRDSYINKRIETDGDLLAQIFGQSLKKLMKECKKHFKKKMDKEDGGTVSLIINQIKSNVIEKDLKTALSTGSWGISHQKNRQGVAQVLKRLTYIQTLSFLRRIKSPSGDNQTANKMIEPRMLHGSQIGFICPVETPEGQPVGLVKNMALSCGITIMLHSQIEIIRTLVDKHLLQITEVDYTYLKRYCKVFLAGDWIGMVKDATQLYDMLRNARFDGVIDKTVGLVYDVYNKKLKINIDGGRLYRPMLVVNDDGTLNITKKQLDEIDIEGDGINTWNKFLTKYPRSIEYVDVEETEMLMLAVKQRDLIKNKEIQDRKVDPADDVLFEGDRYTGQTYQHYTHCEIHPYLLLSVVAANIPFCEHNQSPRNMYQCAQQKQALGVYATDFRIRMPSFGYILHNPQRPLVTTRAMKYTHTTELPAGHNCIVAIMCYTGYNQEDSIIFNKGAIERGIFNATFFRTYKSVKQKSTTTATMDEFKKPDINQVSGMRNANYNKLNEEGYVPEETPVKGDDIIIGKVTPKLAYGMDRNYQDSSTALRYNEKGIVDKVMTGLLNQDDYEMIKSKVRSIRTPTIGDKFCYSPDHQVLTTSGWVNIAELTLKHKVATLVDHEKLEYHCPTAIQEYDHKGNMYCVKSNQVDLMVTPNHKMYVRPRKSKKYRLEEAQKILGARRHYKKNVAIYEPKVKMDKFILPACQDYKGENHPARELNLEAWLIFFGIWIAEGCVHKATKFTVFATHKPRVKEALETACGILGFEIRKHKDKSDDDIRNCWAFKDIQLHDYMKPLSLGAVNKYLPSWVWNLNVKQSRILIDGMMLGDGHKMKGTSTRRYDTSSTRLADDFQRLCLHAGWSTNKMLKYEAGHQSTIKGTGEVITSNADAWRLTVITKQNEPLVNKDKGTKDLLDCFVKYDGKVHCCTSTSGVIYVRRLQKTGTAYPVWSGNSSRHGQKGTVGIVLPTEDMPITEDGIVPDIILNPHAIPSRMTIGQFIECILGKVSAIRGHQSDGTPFEDHNLDQIKDTLEKLGFDRDGREVMYSGITGKKLKSLIFIGPTYYQRLKHMVEDKVHSRARGPIQILTRQPAEGRARDGGLRMGEMERDALIAHGTPQMLKERMMECSDKYVVHVCDLCGLFARKIKDKDAYICDVDGNTSDITKIIMPYAAKLMFQELLSMCIAPRIKIKKNKFNDSDGTEILV